jgi:cellulose biosynthesis protein BcsQ
MKTIAVYNNKGGAGKTTIAAHLCLLAEEWQVPTIGAGLDRQGDLLKWMSQGDAVAKEDAFFERSEFLSIVYSPMVMPELRGVDLVVIDCPVEVEIALTVNPSMWIIPVHGRLGFENMHNVLSDILATKSTVLVIKNNGGRGGVMVDRNLDAALKAVKGLTVYADTLPESDTICRSADFADAAWNLPYANRKMVTTKGASAIKNMCTHVLTQCGFRKPPAVPQKRK